MVVAIDGPAGAGKSTVARAAAERLGFAYLDTGAMYRAVGVAARAGGGRPAECARGLEVVDARRYLVDGREVTDEIRTPAASEDASRIAVDPEVRGALVERQRALLTAGDWVAEGRDIGTVVAPEAELKIYLTASASERAARRALELGTDPQVVLADQTLRDEQDSGREHSPLRPAEDAVELDTSELTAGEVVERIVSLAKERGLA
jgi:cytidylate kinase